jgi:riboflavin transporter FmnP
LLARTDMTELLASRRLTVSLAGAAVFAALAAIMTLAHAEIPFYPISYLQIDFSEIPIVMAFFLFGPLAGAISAIIQWIFLNFQGLDAPLGPAIKFIAVISTLGGFWMGNFAYQNMKSRQAHPTLALSSIFGTGILLRVVAMTIVNYAVLVYIAPVFFGADYVAYAKFTLQQTLGWTSIDNITVLTYTLLFTAVYNVINLLVAAIPAGLIVSPMTSTFRHITSVEAWISKNVRRTS